MYDTAIVNGTVVSDGERSHADLAIDGDRIAEVGGAVAYDGLTLRGRIATTLVNGQIAFERDRPVDTPLGRFVGAGAAAPFSVV
jgi:dihydroorotase-like cyclic amidohydrolase